MSNFIIYFLTYGRFKFVKILASPPLPGSQKGAHKEIQFELKKVKKNHLNNTT